MGYVACYGIGFWLLEIRAANHCLSIRDTPCLGARASVSAMLLKHDLIWSSRFF